MRTTVCTRKKAEKIAWMNDGEQSCLARRRGRLRAELSFDAGAQTRRRVALLDENIAAPDASLLAPDFDAPLNIVIQGRKPTAPSQQRRNVFLSVPDHARESLRFMRPQPQSRTPGRNRAPRLSPFRK